MASDDHRHGADPALDIYLTPVRPTSPSRRMSRGDPSSLRSARPVLGDAEPGVDVTLSATELKFWLIKHLGVHDSHHRPCVASSCVSAASVPMSAS